MFRESEINFKVVELVSIFRDSEADLVYVR